MDSNQKKQVFDLKKQTASDLESKKKVYPDPKKPRKKQKFRNPLFRNPGFADSPFFPVADTAQNRAVGDANAHSPVLPRAHDPRPMGGWVWQAIDSIMRKAEMIGIKGEPETIGMKRASDVERRFSRVEDRRGRNHLPLGKEWIGVAAIYVGVEHPAYGLPVTPEIGRGQEMVKA